MLASRLRAALARARWGVTLAEVEDHRGVSDSLVGVGAGVEAVRRDAGLVVAIEADLALAAQPPRDRDEAIDVSLHRRGETRGMVQEDCADVVHVRHLEAGGAQEGLERELDRFLSAPDREVPDGVIPIPPGLGEDQARLSQVTAGDLGAGQMAMTSPGRKSRFRIQ
jgi:hypothetical protein